MVEYTIANCLSKILFGGECKCNEGGKKGKWKLVYS